MDDGLWLESLFNSSLLIKTVVNLFMDLAWLTHSFADQPPRVPPPSDSFCWFWLWLWQKTQTNVWFKFHSRFAFVWLYSHDDPSQTSPPPSSFWFSFEGFWPRTPPSWGRRTSLGTCSLCHGSPLWMCPICSRWLIAGATVTGAPRAVCWSNRQVRWQGGDCATFKLCIITLIGWSRAMDLSHLLASGDVNAVYSKKILKDKDQCKYIISACFGYEWEILLRF